MGFWRDKETKLWKYKFEYQSKVYGGGGHKTKAEARKAREERRALIKQEIAKGSSNPSGPMTYLEAVSSYLSFSERRHATETFKYKQRVYRLFGDHLRADLPLDAITSSMVSEYLATLPTNPVYNAHRKDLGALFSYAIRVLEIQLSRNPCQVIQKLPQGPRHKKTWTMDEFHKMLGSLTVDERPLILTLAYTMARIDEVLRLTVSDVNLAEGYLTLNTRKNKDGSYRGRNIPIGTQLKEILATLCRGTCHDRLPNEFVFVNPKTNTRYSRRPKMMHTICKRAGITHYGFHAIRHFITSYLYDKKDVGKTDLQRLLGHQTPTTTDIYINGLDDNLRGPVEKLGSLLDENKPATSGGYKVFKPNPAMFSVN
jgi:integrase